MERKINKLIDEIVVIDHVSNIPFQDDNSWDSEKVEKLLAELREICNENHKA